MGTPLFGNRDQFLKSLHLSLNDNFWGLNANFQLTISKLGIYIANIGVQNAKKRISSFMKWTPGLINRVFA